MTNEQIKRATIGANKDQAELVRRANLQEKLEKELKQFREKHFNKLAFIGKSGQDYLDKIFKELETFIHEKIKETLDNYKKELIEGIKKLIEPHPSFDRVGGKNEILKEIMEKEHKLIQSYFLEKYFISTAYRKASTPEEIYYYETIIWEYNKNTRKRGKMLLQEDSGMAKNKALNNHFKLIEKFNP